MTEVSADPVKLAQIEGQLNLANERLRNVGSSISTLSDSFNSWKDAHEDDNDAVARDLSGLKTAQASADSATRNTVRVCTLFISVIGSMFCWFINDKINYMREADSRIEAQHAADTLLVSKRIDSVESRVNSNTQRLDQSGLGGVNR